MKKWRVVCVAAACVAGLWFAGRAVSQDEGKKPPAGEKKETFKGADPREHDPAEMNRRMMEAMTPNRFHKNLERFLGEWDADVAMTFGDQKMASKGKSSTSWLFEGRWIQSDSVSTMMGMPVKGKLLMGYDNFKKKYVGTWVDTMGTAMYTFEGNYGKDQSTLYLYGQMDEYMTGEHDKGVAYVYRFDGPDKYTFEIHDLSIGLEGAKVIEATYTRRK